MLIEFGGSRLHNGAYSFRYSSALSDYSAHIVGMNGKLEVYHRAVTSLNNTNVVGIFYYRACDINKYLCHSFSSL